MSEELVIFFKALADSNRLKIVGLLAEKSYSVEELAELLQLKPSTVSHHLSRLSEAGLVKARSESYYNVYHLDQSVLDEKARTMLRTERLPHTLQRGERHAPCSARASSRTSQPRWTRMPTTRK